MITIAYEGGVEITFGALQAVLDIESIRSSIGFTRETLHKMEAISGRGGAEGWPLTMVARSPLEQHGAFLQQSRDF